MPRDIPVSNGNILVAFDNNYLIREFYFPHIGQENHIKKDAFRFGVWVNGKFNWIPDNWEIKKSYLEDTLVTNVELINHNLQIKIISNDLVDFHENIFVRKMKVKNLSNEKQDIRIFLGHDFKIYGNNIGDTAAYRPDNFTLVHYKNERYFLINSCTSKMCGINQFATGNKGHNQQEGTWKDAEDGVLSNNSIAQGSVDSVMAIQLFLDAQETDTCHYWICVGENYEQVNKLNSLIMKKTPENIYKRTKDYWKLWVNKENINLSMFSEKISNLYKKSLLIARTQIDNCGSIIAANDSDVEQYNRDTYSYMWTRDAALVAYAFDLAGFSEITRRFYNFSAKIIEPKGYFLHKYNPSGSLASSWHPWFKNKQFQLPIQEDETALVIWALWNHYVKYKDIEFIKPLYKPLIKNAANFMLNYRDQETKLPLPSYDLWEERHGVLTFTCASVYGGLIAAAKFTEAFGEQEVADEYYQGAKEIKRAMTKYLYLQSEKHFARMISFDEKGNFEIDSTIDASLYGIFAFGVYEPDDEKVVNTMELVYNKLWCKTEVGGLARYENDSYYKVSEDVPGNPWFVTTLWYAQYCIAIAEKKEDLEKCMQILEWVSNHVLESGVLSEQVHPYTNEPLSVSPLTWSHGTFIMVIHEYLNKLNELS